jgi:hypothetical protein
MENSINPTEIQNESWNMGVRKLKCSGKKMNPYVSSINEKP